MAIHHLVMLEVPLQVGCHEVPSVHAHPGAGSHRRQDAEGGGPHGSAKGLVVVDIHVLTPCFVGTQEAERRWVTHGDEGAKRGIVRGTEQLSLRGVTTEVQGVPVARDKVLEVRLSL
eukprot:6213596-Pleurochrysis_carterae.AAC.2